MQQMTQTLSKKIDKIKLINWQGFINETININGLSALFTGSSGSGKSTVMDAILLVLTGNDNIKFNSAADSKNKKRSIKGYIHYALNDETERFFRNGNTVSFVAIQFVEEKKNGIPSYFVIGVNIESPGPSSDTLNKIWFEYEGTLDDIPFVESNVPKGNSEFKKWLLNNSNKRYHTTTDKAAREEIINRRLELDKDGDKYYEAIKKFIAFSPMSDIDRFIKENILAKEPIRIDEMIETYKTLANTQEQLEALKKESEALKSIISQSEDVEKASRRCEKDDFIIDIAQLEKLKENQAIDEKCVNELERKKARVEEKFEEVDESLSQLKNQRDVIKEALSSNDDEARKIMLRERIEDHNEQLKSNKYKFQQVENYLDKASDFFEENGIKNVSIKREEILSDKIETTAKYYLCEEIDNKIEDIKDENENAIRAGKKELSDLEGEICTIEDNIEKIKKGKLPIDDKILQLKQAIENDFEVRGINSEVFILCDWLEINDEEWADAIESYLGAQRFYLVVDPSYYNIAADIYNKNKNKIFGVGVINISKIKDKIQPIDGALSEKIESDNVFVKCYADFLLGKVVMCNDVKELKKYDSAITKECMLYKNHVLRNIKKQGENRFIGKKAQENQLRQYEDEFIRKKLERVQISENINRCECIIKKANEIRNVHSFLDSPFQVSRLNELIKKENEELKEIEKSASNMIERTIELRERLNRLDAEIKEKSKDKDSMRQDLADLRAEIKQKESLLNETEVKIKSDQSILDSRRDKNIKVYKEAMDDIEKGIKFGKDYSYYAEKYDPIKARNLTIMKNAEQELELLQRAYFKGTDYGFGINNIDAYRNRYEVLVGKEITRLSDSVRDLKKQAYDEFFDMYLGTMRKNIETAKSELSKLNRTLKNIQYGKDRYEFCVGPADDQENKELYDALTDPMITFDSDRTLFDDYNDSDHKDVLERISKKIFETNITDSERDILTDYRELIKCDIKITNSAGRTQLFSKTVGYASGGETETPYYLSVVASFHSIFANKNCIRTVLFDEAFSRMDDKRIQSMLQFMNKLGFQVIVAMPPNRASVAFGHVGTVIQTHNDVTHKIMKVQTYAQPRT